MTPRIPLLLALFATCPAVGLAQGFSSPLPPPIPVPTTKPPSMIRPWIGVSPWWSVPAYYYPWAYYEPRVRSVVPIAPPPLQGAGGPGPVLTNPELPATFTLEFPADVTLWLNGQKVPDDGRTRVLTSPVLKAGASFTFAVRAEWTTDGKRYEWDRTVVLSAGEKARATIARGFPIKD